MDIKIGNLFSYLSYFIFITLLLFPFIFPALHWDEATYLLGGAWINKGAIIYNDFIDNKLPPIYYISAILEKLITYNFYLYRAVVILFHLISAYLFSILVKKSGKIEYISLYLFVIFLLGIYPYSITETYSFPLVLASFILFERNSFFSGLIAGIAVVIRHILAVPFSGVLLYNLLIKNKVESHHFYFSVGALVFPSLLLLFIFSYVGVENFYNFMEANSSYTYFSLKAYLDLAGIPSTSKTFMHLVTLISFIIVYVLILFLNLKLFFKSHSLFQKELALFSLILNLFNVVFLTYISSRFFALPILLMISAFSLFKKKEQDNLSSSILRFIDKNSLLFILFFLFVLTPFLLSSILMHKEYFLNYSLAVEKYSSLLKEATYFECTNLRSYNTYYQYLFNRDKEAFPSIVYYHMYYNISFDKESVKNNLMNGTCYIFGDLIFAPFNELLEEGYAMQYPANGEILIVGRRDS